MDDRPQLNNGLFCCWGGIASSVFKSGLEPSAMRAQFIAHIDKFDNTLLKALRAKAAAFSEWDVTSELDEVRAEEIMRTYRRESSHIEVESVRDPRTNRPISWEDAKSQGIVNIEDGVYFKNPDLYEAIPLQEAMLEGAVTLGIQKVRTTPEKKTNFGLITIKTIRQATTHYNIRGVRDTSTELILTLDEAIHSGVIDDKHGLYVDKKENKEFLVSEAIEKKYIEAELPDQIPEPEVVYTKYVVRAVNDVKHSTTISYKTATEKGILDKDSGVFLNTNTGEKMPFTEAIIKGYVRARQINNDLSLIDIHPDNRTVIDKTDKIRKRLLAPLKVISAFKDSLQAKNKQKST